ncbi:MAG TPA: halogenase [Deltaproteobacteria bacterium]|nr:halogenase [Deltaproteobacteria bacterium]HCP45529.1 halogenase [Deltaproteobacteria bacterium]
MAPNEPHDLVILGGGLAGLCLARQLSLARPETKILVAEGGKRPAPQAAFKIGESSVEVAGHYLHNVLGLADYLNEHQLPKLGLRYFMSQGDNSDITRRLEMGPIRNKVQVPFNGLLLPSYQLDRGTLENHLIELLETDHPNVTFQQQCRVADIAFGPGEATHQVTLRTKEENGERVEETLQTRWVIDAAGRGSFLKKKLGNEIPNDHHCNGVWFRLRTRIQVDNWSEDQSFQDRVNERARWRSTVHLMGHGYWLWIIPLSGGETSIGVVADERVHPYRSLASWTKIRAWLKAHEPQLSEKVEAAADQKLDFAATADFTLNCTSVTGGDDRWGMTGDAGLFTDPLYSPGTDFICIVNTMQTDLITRELDGESIGTRAERSNYYLKLLYDQFMQVYRDGYLVMGNPRVNTVKVVFDNGFYWGWVALMGMNGRATDPDVLDPFHEVYMRSIRVMVGFQRFIREWNEAEPRQELPFDHIDQFDIRMLWNIYTVLIRPVDGESLRKRLTKNLERLEAYCEHVFRQLFQGDPEVEAAVGLDVTKLTLDRTKWAEWGTLEGPDRHQLVGQIAAGMAPLWSGSSREASAA